MIHVGAVLIKDYRSRHTAEDTGRRRTHSSDNTASKMAPLHRTLTPTIFLASFLSVTSFVLPPSIQVYRIDDGIPQNILRLENHTDIIIVGGRNALYKFTLDLELEDQLSTGPQEDNPECPPDPLPCEHDRTPTDNDNKVLLQMSGYPSVFSCGFTWQGICYVHNVRRNFTKVYEFDKALHVNYVASRAETVAFFGEGQYKTVLFSASTYDDRPEQFHHFSVAARRFAKNSLPLALEDTHVASFIDIVTEYKKAYKVHYIHGFIYAGFVYLLTVQNKGISLTTFETRLARVCMTDLSFLTYMEVPLKCNLDEKNYSLAEAASLHVSSASRLKKKASGDQGMTLSVAFGRPYSGEGYVVDPSLGSGLCQFKMQDVIAMFETTTNDCNKGGQGASLLRLLHGQSNLRCHEYTAREGSDYCMPGNNNYIESKLHLSGTLIMTMKDTLITSLLVLAQGEGSRRKNIAWVGDNKGRLHKCLVSGRLAQLLYYANISHPEEGSSVEPRIRKSVAVDRDESSAYFLTGRSVVKFPIGSCSIYESCATCLNAADDPLGCGWCEDRCAHRAECNSTLDLRTCPVQIDKVYPTTGPVSGGTLLTIEGNNLGTQHEPYLSSISVTVANASCQIYWWNFTVVQCVVPPADNATSAEIRVTVDDTTYTYDKRYDILDTQILKEPFQYLEITIHRMHPTFGPMSGGTNITITGFNLNAGTTHEVKINGDLDCKIHSISEEAVTCQTPDVKKAALQRYEMPVEYFVDNVKVPWSCGQQCYTKSLFKYSVDPVIESVEPKNASFSGGTNVTVRGFNLNAVFQPMLVFQGDGGNTISTVCQALYGGTMMTCIVPSLHNSSIVNEQRIKKYSLPILVRGHFQMDSLTLGAKPGKAFFEFIYLPDPVFEDFGGEDSAIEVGLDDLTLEIPGRHLNSISSKKDVNIKVGDLDFACNVTDIQSTALFCSLRPEDFNEESEHHVQVTLAGRSYNIGAIRLIPAKRAGHTGLVVAIVVVIFIAILIAAGVVYYIRGRHKKRVPEYFVDFSNRGGDGGRAPGSNNYVRPNDAEAREALMGPAFELDSETRSMLQSEKILFDRELLILGPVIGQGHFGCVYRGTLELQGKGEVLSVAVKTLHNNSRSAELDGKAFLEEALIMKDFHHPNVLSLIGLCVDSDGQLMVITPYMKYGDLLSYIRDERNSPTVKDLITYGIHIAEGMNYLSSQKFVHRDLAARNCMLSEDFTVHVADFGLSRDVYEKDYYSGDNKKTKLPVKWMAPESLEKGIYNHKTDVWAYGVVLWELMTRGVTPYPEVDNWDIVNFLKQGRRMQQPSFCPDMLYEIMLQCWEEDPKKRPSFARLERDVSNVITTLQKKKRDREVGLKVTYVNYPRTEDDEDEEGESSSNER